MPIKILRRHTVRCAGCGQVGPLLCDHCLEIYRITKERVKKLEDTLRVQFAMRGKF